MTAVILFRFHSDFDVCRERLRLLRYLNPSLPVHGLYGGTKINLGEARRALSGLLENIHVIPTENPIWKWMHPDLAIRQWFMATGHRLSFDRLYEYEYDLLLGLDVDSLFPPVTERTVAFSGLKSLESARTSWYWTSVEPFRSAFVRYTEFMQRQYGLVQQAYVSQGPFPVLSRSYLEAIAAAEYPPAIFNLVMNEISYPGMAEALHFTIVDTGIHPEWTPHVPGVRASDLFHCEKGHSVDTTRLLAELRDPNGRRAFHPVKQAITCETITAALDRVSVR